MTRRRRGRGVYAPPRGLRRARGAVEPRGRNADPKARARSRPGGPTRSSAPPPRPLAARVNVVASPRLAEGRGRRRRRMRRRVARARLVSRAGASRRARGRMTGGRLDARPSVIRARQQVSLNHLLASLRSLGGASGGRIHHDTRARRGIAQSRHRAPRTPQRAPTRPDDVAASRASARVFASVDRPTSMAFAPPPVVAPRRLRRAKSARRKSRRRRSSGSRGARSWSTRRGRGSIATPPSWRQAFAIIAQLNDERPPSTRARSPPRRRARAYFPASVVLQNQRPRRPSTASGPRGEEDRPRRRVARSRSRVPRALRSASRHPLPTTLELDPLARGLERLP